MIPCCVRFGANNGPTPGTGCAPGKHGPAAKLMSVSLMRFRRGSAGQQIYDGPARGQSFRLIGAAGVKCARKVKSEEAVIWPGKRFAGSRPVEARSVSAHGKAADARALCGRDIGRNIARATERSRVRIARARARIPLYMYKFQTRRRGSLTRYVRDYLRLSHRYFRHLTGPV